jgi:glutamate-1-semialdehyde 2,1-aminomutase
MKAADKYNKDLQVNHFGSMINAFFTAEQVRDFASAQTSDTEKFKLFFWNMMERGVFLPPSQFEAWFLSTALDENDMNTLDNAIDESFKAISEKFNR